MKNIIFSLLSDTGTVSMTRFLSLVCVLSAVLISLTVVVKEQPLDSAVGLVSVFLGAGFAGKVAQKFAEVKSDEEK
jgi:hypothetical protein